MIGHDEDKEGDNNDGNDHSMSEDHEELAEEHDEDQGDYLDSNAIDTSVEIEMTNLDFGTDGNNEDHSGNSNSKDHDDHDQYTNKGSVEDDEIHDKDEIDEAARGDKLYTNIELRWSILKHLETS